MVNEDQDARVVDPVDALVVATATALVNAMSELAGVLPGAGLMGRFVSTLVAEHSRKRFDDAVRAMEQKLAAAYVHLP